MEVIYKGERFILNHGLKGRKSEGIGPAKTSCYLNSWQKVGRQVDTRRKEELPQATFLYNNPLMITHPVPREQSSSLLTTESPQHPHTEDQTCCFWACVRLNIMAGAMCTAKQPTSWKTGR
jgi:hypothetical protein